MGHFHREPKQNQRFSYDYKANGGCEWTCYIHFLYPYLEQSAYYEAIHGPQFDLPNPWADPAAWPSVVNNMAMPVLRCPSDTSGNGVVWMSVNPPLYLPKSNYLGFFSGLCDNDGYLADNPKQWAVFRYQQGTPFSAITDGTSNTMALAEYLQGPGSDWVRGDIHTNRAGNQMLYVTTGPNSTVSDKLDDSDGFCPSNGKYNQPADNLPCSPSDGNADYATSRSRHPGGVSALFCDGSVHFIPDNIDLTTWRYLGWIADDGIVTDAF